MQPWLKSVHSDGSKLFVSNPTPKRGETITIKLRVIEKSPITHVIFRTKLNGVEIQQVMEPIEVIDQLIYYQTNVTVYEDEIHYHFYLVTDEKVYYYNQKEITDYIPTETYDFRILVDYEQPTWVKSSVFYQIFPERFFNGNPENDVVDGEYTFDGGITKKVKDWNTVPAFYKDTKALDFYGGDLEGITMKIPYLKALGVNAIYLNPIFYAATVHKYDCLDYFRVDPHFGGDQALMDLVDELHKNNMKIILDVSINHTGTAHKWFNKDALFFDKTIGAYHNPKSLERQYYFFNEDHSYKAWFDVPTLPTLNYTSKALRDILYEGEDSMVKKWLKPPFNIDGWRFDVADIMARNDLIQLHHEVWPGIRKSIKSVNPEAYILGEDWSDCAEFLNGDELDSAMNYFGFARPVREFVGETDLFNRRNPLLNNKPYRSTAIHLHERIMNYLAKLPFVIWQNQFNLLDSHDVSRLHNNPKIHPGDYWAAVILMMTMPGAANVYYGDEIGIDGRLDDNEGFRYPMPWDKVDTNSQTFKTYQALIKLKTSKRAFGEGSFKVMFVEHRVFSFVRFTKEEVWLIVTSTDDEERLLTIPLHYIGVKDFSKKEDYLKQKLHYQLMDQHLYLKVTPHTSYVIELTK